jgi:hypothetical protein
VPEPLDPLRLFTVLERHQVDYVLIGGLAAVLYGSAVVTNDADICPSRADNNLVRLAAALRDLHARVRSTSEPDGVAFSCDPEMLARVRMLNLHTDAGEFDLAFEPAGFTSYDELAAHAEPFVIEGIHVRVGALRDVIRSKETANRVKDRAALPHLYALEDEIAARNDDH